MMDAVCEWSDGVCQVRALATLLHSINLYCASIFAALICCCATGRSTWKTRQWQYQNLRGVTSIVIALAWCCGAATASLRSGNTVYLVMSLMSPLAWVAAAVLHVVLWSHRSTSPILYLAVYWLLTASSAAAILYEHIKDEATLTNVEVTIQSVTMLCASILAAVDSLCFYDEVANNSTDLPKSSQESSSAYKHNESHFYAKITFFWLNLFMYNVYEKTLDGVNLGSLPNEEKSKISYQRIRNIFNYDEVTDKEKVLCLWKCYFRIVWPNFYIAGIMKLFGDLCGIIVPLSFAVIIQFIENPTKDINYNSEVTLDEFTNNGYIMLVIVILALVLQALLSQYSTHLVNTEGTRLKSSLQTLVFDKCMRLASWSAAKSDVNEHSPLLRSPKDEAKSQTGMLMNLVTQDTYNIMSCVWICHYTWAIPLKVIVILYVLYSKLGVSAIVGVAASVFIVTPLQFFIGKKISDNTRNISKCTDHRVSIMSEILNGMNVIKLYVWEDLFNEKILQFREVELRHLNKDSAYWSFLSFTAQFSSILNSVVTFTTHYLLNNGYNLTTVNIFAGLALFNQLSIPLLILPVTVLMVIQAMVSTRRIKEFLELPESDNIKDDKDIHKSVTYTAEFPDPVCEVDDPIDEEVLDRFVDEGLQHQDYLMRFKNAAFSWRVKDNAFLEIEDLDILAGKLIMVVGSSGSGKTSLLSAILGEMQLEQGQVNINSNCSTWYAGQPPWLLDWSIRDNILMGTPWCSSRYARVIRATALRPDLQLLPDGESTVLGSYGAPLSGGQRVRVCVARALYSRARLVALDEPLAALDAPLAKHVVARGLLPAARTGRTIILATNRLELLNYADLVIVMDNGRVSGVSRPGAMKEGSLCEWWQLAAEARANVAKSGAGPPGGTAQERSTLIRTMSRVRYQNSMSQDNIIGINEATGAHLLAELSTYAGGTWRRIPRKTRTPLSRQFSSPPPFMHNQKLNREVRRTVSADASDDTLQHQVGLLRRLLQPRAQHTLTRWTPKTLRRFISSDSESSITSAKDSAAANNETTLNSIISSGIESATVVDASQKYKDVSEPALKEGKVWLEYIRSCGWWGLVYFIAAATAQTLTVAADCWLSLLAQNNSQNSFDSKQVWDMLKTYAIWCVSGVLAGGFAQCACACAGATARRHLHDRLLRATLNAPLHHHHTAPQGAYTQRFSADISVVDKKLPTAVSRWIQLALLCVAAMLVNVILSPWTLVALLPAFLFYIALQAVYLRNVSELQRLEASSAAGVVSLTAQCSVGAVTVRAGNLQNKLREIFQQRVNDNHNTLLLLNSANRWLGLGLDLVGVLCVLTTLSVALHADSAAAVAGLAGTYSLLLPVYLAHLAKCRADLHLQLASLERILTDINVPQEDYRDDCAIPSGWQRNGKIEFQDVDVQHQPDSPIILKTINLTINSGQKIALCGRSGSGKSTLLMTCVGATTVRSGRVLVDGQDITRVPLKALRHRIVVLPQETIIFTGTLRENLDPLAIHTDEEIWRCLKAVGLYDFVTAQNAGLECMVNGSGWSGGRVGRVCAGRAALHAGVASALLLDEPAAALDAAAQRALLQALAALAPNTTILTVAHRISSVRDYDSTVILEEGRVVERGNINTLVSDPSSRLAKMTSGPAQLV